jgi:hypothetical protein
VQRRQGQGLRRPAPTRAPVREGGGVCSCFRCRPTPTFRESRPPSSPLSFARFAREGTAPPARARPWWPRSLRSASAWTTPCAPAATSAPSGRTA